jgi:hypothetical protein
VGDFDRIQPNKGGDTLDDRRRFNLCGFFEEDDDAGVVEDLVENGVCSREKWTDIRFLGLLFIHPVVLSSSPYAFPGYGEFSLLEEGDTENRC